MRDNVTTLFLLRAISGLIPCFAVWYSLGKTLTIPVFFIAKWTVAVLFPNWAEGVEQIGTILTLVTSLEIPNMKGLAAEQVVVLTPQVDYLKYSYGLPLLIALLFASRADRFLIKIFLGWVLLWPFQVWGICFNWLVQISLVAKPLPVLPVGIEFIVFGYQFGYLMLPTLVPVILWAIMDTRFLGSFVKQATKEKARTKTYSKL